ncbi:hypothetical protein C2S53_018737 [Perilla frutescens var. hirtella]|uniref:SHSP domain-containing protein n=1 Tax=Perilla frutescens var. hirtella TaxID=608512 RepID=A0AAD4IQN4_PERFH|nr:hypothetical protein C2S53_018737 [Perilla frutescens var. hirtella]
MASDVQGFKKGEVRIRAHNLDHVIVSGERQADDSTILHFEQSYKVPEGCNVQETSAILEEETYYVIIPKKLNSKKENSISTSVQGDDLVQDRVSDGVDNTNNDDYSQDLEGMTEKYDEEKLHRTSSGDESSDSSFLDKLSKKLKKKRCLVLTAFLAFTLGVLVSHRYQSTPQVERSQ